MGGFLCYLLFSIASSLYTLLPSPGALTSNINKTKHQILIKGAVSPNLVLLKNPINVSVLIRNQLVVA